MEVYADADEILQEEIKEYKVGYNGLGAVGWWSLGLENKVGQQKTPIVESDNCQAFVLCKPGVGGGITPRPWQLK